MSKQIKTLKTKLGDGHPLAAPCGVKTDGTPYVIDIDQGPHWLLCGTTGSGKSVFANSLLIALIYSHTPDTLKISWIDPKGGAEAAPYNELPYCPIPPIIKNGDAYGFLSYLVLEMRRRNQAIKNAGHKDIKGFNKWYNDGHSDEAAELGYPDGMPYWVAMIDEYANIHTECPDADELFKTLAAMSRSAGIHVILATQRPSADVIPGTLKSNLPSRIALTVASSVDSMIALDHEGAEKLHGHGDGIVRQNGKGEVRVQGLYISDEEIANIFAFLREKYGAITYDQYHWDGEKVAWNDDAKFGPYKEIEYKTKVTDPAFCKQWGYDAPMCDWMEGESPSDFPNEPEKWHVKQHKTRRW